MTELEAREITRLAVAVEAQGRDLAEAKGDIKAIRQWTRDRKEDCDRHEREYFLEAVTGQTIAAHNVLSVYFHRETASPLVYMAVLPTAGTTRSAAIVISSATVAAFNSGTTENAYFDFNYEAAANGWVRCWIYFAGDPDGAGATATDVGKAFTVRIGPSSAYTTAARTVGIWGAQFEQGVTTPSAYLQRP